MTSAFLPPDQGTIDQLQQMGSQMQSPEDQAEPTQQGEPQPEPAAEDQQQGAAPAEQQPPADHTQYESIDLEGCISAAIETGCHLAEAATVAEDYERFAHGVNLLCLGLAKIQPASDPGDTAIATAQIAAAQRDRQAAAQAQAAASRPTPTGN